jgi:hypothetical protein
MILTLVMGCKCVDNMYFKTAKNCVLDFVFLLQVSGFGSDMEPIFFIRDARKGRIQIRIRTLIENSSNPLLVFQGVICLGFDFPKLKGIVAWYGFFVLTSKSYIMTIHI